MEKNHSWIRELGLVTVVSSLMLLMFPLGSMAAQGDWSINHNWEYVPNGETCYVLASDGVNYIDGTFEWGYGQTFEYTYDRTETWIYVYPQPSWSSGLYTFDFYTEWEPDYGEKFEIRPSTAPVLYSCNLPL